jgi:Eukaryotic glutathione synthase, ATP binding domain
MSQSYASLLSNWPPPLQDHELKDLTSRGASFALSNALQYLPRGTTSETSANPAQAIHAPFTLFPTPFPRKLFEQARKVQRIYNVLYARVSWDKDFLDKVFNEIGDPDDFCVILWKRWKTAEKNIFQVSSMCYTTLAFLFPESCHFISAGMKSMLICAFAVEYPRYIPIGLSLARNNNRWKQVPVVEASRV